MKILIVEDEVLIREGIATISWNVAMRSLKQVMAMRPWASFTGRCQICLAGYPAPNPQWPGSPQDHPEDQLGPCFDADGLP